MKWFFKAGLIMVLLSATAALADPPQLHIPRIAAPHVDGVIEADEWQGATQIPRLLLMQSGRAPEEASRVYLGHDGEHLYIAVDARETYLNPVLQQTHLFRKAITERDGPVSQDDSIEIFIQPEAQGTYYQVVANALGTIFDASAEKPAEIDNAWDSGAKAAASISDYGWQLEIAIPLASLGDGLPAPDQWWGFNICRTERPRGEYSQWSVTTQGYHAPEQFGRIAFGNTPVPTVSRLDLPPYEGGEHTLAVTVTVPEGTPAESGRMEFTANMRRGEHEQVHTRALDIAPGHSEDIGFDVVYDETDADGTALDNKVQWEFALRHLPSGAVLWSSPGHTGMVRNIRAPLQTRLAFRNWEDKFNDIADYHVVPGGPVNLPFIFTSNTSEEIGDLSLRLEVPASCYLVDKTGTTWLKSVQCSWVERDGRPYRRYEIGISHTQASPADVEGKAVVLSPLTIAATADALPGEYVLYYQISSNEISEVEKSAPLHVLRPFHEIRPSRSFIVNWPSGNHRTYIGSLADPEREAYIWAWSRAGYTDSTDVWLMPGMDSMRRVSLLPGAGHPFPGGHEHIRNHPEDRGRTFSGETDAGTVCPVRLLEEDCAFREPLSRTISSMARNVQHLDWDYEVPTIRDNSFCFCPRCISAFAAAKDIPDAENLTPPMIREKYKAQWIDWRCGINAQLMGMLTQWVKEGNPDCIVSAYSGYQNDYTLETYGVDWRYMSKDIDVVICGYGRNVESIQNTLAAIGDKQLVCSEGIWGAWSSYDMRRVHGNLVTRLVDSMGGLMTYYDAIADGRMLMGVSDVAAIAADFEDEFWPYALAKDEITATGTRFDPVVMQGRRGIGVFLHNTTAVPEEITLQVNEPNDRLVGLEWFSGEVIKPFHTLRTTLAPFECALYYIADSGIKPHTPARPQARENRDIRGVPQPLLRWRGTHGAGMGYEVQVAANGQPADQAPVHHTHHAHLPLGSLDLAPGTRFAWRVRGVDRITGLAGEWSEIVQGEIPGAANVALTFARFAPGSDGHAAATTITGRLHEDGGWQLTVSDVQDQVLRTFTGSGSEFAVTWDGTNEAGEVENPGHYRFALAGANGPLPVATVEISDAIAGPHSGFDALGTWAWRSHSGSGEGVRDFQVSRPGSPYSLRLDGYSDMVHSYFSTYNAGANVPVTPGKTYVYTAWCKLERNGGNGAAEVSISFLDETGNFIAIPGHAIWGRASEQLKEDSDWTPISVELEAPENARTMAFGVKIIGTGTAWFDSPVVEEK